jgi:5'-methylthioadenosine phosphorylase
MAVIGIIGGSGLEDPDILKDPEVREVSTRFGVPSSTLTSGSIGGTQVIVLSRHDRDHHITPTKVPNRANIQALKDNGCTHVLATTAAGSLREEILRGDFVVLDQFIDFTRRRDSTVFEDFRDGLHHTSMADPFDAQLREALIETADALEITVHRTGTVVTIEGPRFSTRAESRMFRLFGGDVINMSTAPECIIANELEIPYAAVAMSTDYDSWKDDEEPVTWEAVLEIFRQNAEKMTRLLVETVPRVAAM